MTALERTEALERKQQELLRRIEVLEARLAGPVPATRMLEIKALAEQINAEGPKRGPYARRRQ